MHSIETTPGLIIESRPYGEAGKVLAIFTRDFGLVSATAQGIRLEKSKLRYYTQEHSFGVFSLVRGREMWRLTSASEMFAGTNSLRFGGEMSMDKFVREGREMMIRVSVLLRRLLHGEEPHPELFDIVHACAVFLQGMETDVGTLESITVLRMLHALGYIGKDPLFEPLFRSPEVESSIIELMKDKRHLINQHINKALRESHL